MEAVIEAYLDQKAIKYEKNIDGVILYILEDEIVENIEHIQNNIDIEKISEINEFLNKNNIKYKHVLNVSDEVIYIDYQININDFKFIVQDDIFLGENILSKILFYSEYIKFIKNNTVFKFEEYIINDLNTYGDCNIRFSIDYSHIYVTTHKLKRYEFSLITEFIDWFTVNLPEYLRNDDIKIALKD